MRLDFEMTEGILVAAVTGELDHHGASLTREEIDKEIEAHQSKHLILDFQGVSFMDSSGIGVVMGRYNKIKAKGGKIYVANCSTYIKKILEMAGIFTIAGLSGSVPEAIVRIQAQIDQEVRING